MRALVAVFDQQNQAQQARTDLLGEGFADDHLHLAFDEDDRRTASTGKGAHDETIGEKIADFFGVGSADRETYSEAMRRGSYVLITDVENEQEAARAENILETHDPIDIDERAAEWRKAGWTGGAAADEETVVPVVKEELKVGKRETERGGVRVRTHDYERPAEADVSLHEEHGVVERRPADRPASEADLARGDESYEVRDTAEEPVVGKDARVVEEVAVRKEATDRTERVRDSVRGTEVDVEDIDGADDRNQGRQRGRKGKR